MVIAINALAGGIGEKCQPIPASVPCEKEAWGFDIQALYMSMSFNDAQSFDVFTAPSTGRRHYQSTDPDWGWGFKVGASYLFNTGNDFTVSWYHLDDNKKIKRFSQVTPNDLSQYSSLWYRVDPQWDAVNAELGQHVDVGFFKDVRFFGGLQYAEFEISQLLSGTNGSGQQALNVSRQAEFGGVGPRVGAELSYRVGKGFAIGASSAISILIGSQDYKDNSLNINTTPVNSIQKAHRTSVVPSVEAKISGQYGCQLLNGNASIEAGWMVVNYYNAFTTFSAQDSSDFAIYGPYLGAHWIGEIV